MSEYIKLEEDINNYEENMRWFLPIDEIIKKLKEMGLSIDDMKKELKDNSYVLDYVPDTLYHGSRVDVDILNPNESTQAGSHVYATDNPVHALFFSIFNNSSICRGSIREKIDEEGNYKVKYVIDERVKGAIDNLIKDEDIYIYVVYGEDFVKPHGEAFITREWVSNDGKEVKPFKKIKINPKEFFKDLEEKGLVKYDRYDKSKDIETVCNYLGLNYSYGLFTERAKDIDEYDSKCDKRISVYFGDYLEFSKCFRKIIKDIVNEDLRKDNPSLTIEEEKNIKLRKNKELSNKCYYSRYDSNGKRIITPNTDVIDEIIKNCECKKR